MMDTHMRLVKKMGTIVAKDIPEPKHLLGRGNDFQSVHMKPAGVTILPNGFMSDKLMNKPKRLRDTNQLAKRIGDLTKGEETETHPYKSKNPAADELGRVGGKKGGKARAKSLTPEKRKEIAQKAARKRWSKE